MTSLTRDSNHIGNHVDRNGTRHHHNHNSRSNAEDVSRSRPKTHGKGERSSETSSRGGHEARTRPDYEQSSRSHASASSSESSCRRSSRNADDGSNSQRSSSRSSRQAADESSRHRSPSATRRRSVDNERGVREHAEYGSNGSSRRRDERSSKHHRNNTSIEDDIDMYFTLQTEAKNGRSESSIRRSSSASKGYDGSEQTLRDISKRKVDRHSESHDRKRSSSQTRDPDCENHVDRKSHGQSYRGEHTDYSNTHRDRRRQSRSDNELGDDPRDGYRVTADNNGGYRDGHGQGHYDRRRSNAGHRSEQDVSYSRGPDGQDVSYSRRHSSSRHSLVQEDMGIESRSTTSRTRHETASTLPRHERDPHHMPSDDTPRVRSGSVSVNKGVPIKKSPSSHSKTSSSKENTNHQNKSTHDSKLENKAAVRPENKSTNDVTDSSARKHAAKVSSHAADVKTEFAAGESSRRQIKPPAGHHRSDLPGDDHVGVAVSESKHDVSLSRRSSSSRSNHDTGFASSSSSPRRDDSQSKLTYDASPSRHVDDDAIKARAEETRRKRRSKMTNNNSLDVPGGTLRKEQSLSSSGKGDSSFEEPSTENVSPVKGHRKILEEQNKNTLTHSSERATPRFRGEHSSLNNNEELKTTGLRGKDIVTPETCNNSFGSKSVQDSSKPLAKNDGGEWNSSTSTVKGNGSSRSYIAGSITSLLARASKDVTTSKPGSPEGSVTSNSVSDRWRRIKQGILPDTGPSTLTGKESAAAIFTAAAARFMSSLPNSITKNISLPTSSPSTPPTPHFTSTPTPHMRGTDSGTSLPNSQTKTSEISGGSQAKTDDTTTASRAKTEDVKPGSRARSDVSPAFRVLSDVSPARQSVTDRHSDTLTEHKPTHRNVPSTNGPNYGKPTNPRPSVISSTLHNNSRTSGYTKLPRGTDPLASPQSEDSGQMTPPPLDTDMKRRSKEVDGELTSFLPAEMSRREEKFHDAARDNDAVLIRTLLKEKVNVNCRNSLDRTALHWAAANGNFSAVEALIEGGADLEAKDKYGMRAVLWSAWFGHIPVLKALVNAGANTRVTNKQGLGVIHCAAENNHVAVIAFIFDALETHDVNKRDKNDRTPLHSAAEGGHVDAVSRLLEAKADLHKKDKGGMTAVHLAAKHGHIDVLKALLLQGVEVDDRDVEGKTALHLAAEAGHKETVDLLLDYTANPNSETIKEITPLHLAAIEGHVEVCKSLVKYGCNTNAQNHQGNTALHLAANGNHKEVARVLVDAKCELDLPNSRMQTPLHVAVECGYLEVVQVLLAGGASMDTREKSGKSALQLAARGNYVAVVDMLIKAERYYANTREYHDKDVGYVDPDTYLRNAQHPHAPQMKDVLWKLATKQLKSSDWKKLAYHWHFTPEHVKAIEQEYTGATSYKEHSFRLLNIWLHGVRKDENVLKLLFEALVAIDRKQLAESVRRKVHLLADKPCSPTLCVVS